MGDKLDIIIVNWNSGALLRACLESVASTQLSDLRVGRIVVVDNGSTDGSLDGIEIIHPLIQLIRNVDNRGFAAACNQGAASSNAEYFLFLNPDTKIHSESLEVPLRVMDDSRNASLGICGIRLLDGKGVVSRTCCRFPTTATLIYRSIGLDMLLPKLFLGYTMKEWDHGHSAGVDHVIGAFYLVRQTVFRELDGFDERYFVYLEDLDFSLRARSAGWYTCYLADAYAYHIGGGTSSKAVSARLFYALRGRIQYAFKHFRFGSALLVLFSTALAEIFCRLVRAMMYGSTKDMSDIFAAYLRLWKDLPRILIVTK